MFWFAYKVTQFVVVSSIIGNGTELKTIQKIDLISKYK